MKKHKIKRGVLLNFLKYSKYFQKKDKKTVPVVLYNIINIIITLDWIKGMPVAV